MNLAYAHGTTEILKTFIVDIDKVFKDTTLESHPNAVRYATAQRILILKQLLLYATNYGHLEVVTFWLDSNLAIEISVGAFHSACALGHDQIVACMLAKNSLLVKSKDNLSRIGLDFAAIYAREKVLDVLLKYKTPRINISKNLEAFHIREITTFEYVNQIKDETIRKNFIQKISAVTTDKDKKIQTVSVANKRNYLFPLIPAIMFFISMFTLLLINVKFFQYLYPLPLSLAGATLCGFPVMIYRNQKEKALIKKLMEEDSENLNDEKQADEKTPLLDESNADNHPHDDTNLSSYSSIKQEISLPMPEILVETGKEEESLNSSSNQNNQDGFEHQPISGYSSFYKKSEPKKEAHLASGHPEDSEFGGIVHGSQRDPK